MSSDGTDLKNLKIRMAVEINPQFDHTRKKIITGKISEILTKAKHHPHGILVRLESGEKGRVKKILEQPNNIVKNIKVLHTEDQLKTLKELIVLGENQYVEFKSGALWSARFTSDDIKKHKPQSKELCVYGQSASKVIISKTISGFLNSNGGTLIIGVKENKNSNDDEIIGIESEFEKLKDPCEDGYRRMIIDVINKYFPKFIFNHLDDFIKINFEVANEKVICGITALKSDRKVFLRIKNLDHFYIRIDASTRELQGVELVEYCENRFQN